MFLHQSLYAQKFNANKKLNLLKNKFITIGQFLSLLQPSDPYVLIGSTVVDKDYQNQFIKQWKQHKHNIKNISDLPKISSNQFIDNLNIVLINFPQTKQLINQFFQKLKTSSCSNCTKNRYLLLIATKIKQHYNDGRQYSEYDKFIFQKILNKYFPFDNQTGIVNLQVSNIYDNTWIQPDSLINIGYDLIDGLTNCFQCAKKHIVRAKTLYGELYLGYPKHIQLMFNQFTEANKVIEQAYVLYWDILGQLDMSSSQLVGQLIDLPSCCREQIIELANKIRTARINYQENVQNIPDWNKLLIEIQLLENKFNKKYKDIKK